MYVTISELSRMANVTRATIYNNLKDLRKLGYTKDTNGKSLIDTKSIDYLNRNKPKIDKPIESRILEESNLQNNFNEIVLQNYINTQKDLLNKLENLQQQLEEERNHSKELELKIIEMFRTQDIKLLEEPKPKKINFFRRFLGY